MKTSNAGIDYGLGKSNVDKATGIRYGVISQNDVGPEAVNEIYDGENLSYEGYLQEAKDKLRGALSDYFSETAWDGKRSKLDAFTDDAFEAIEQGLADNYQGDCDKYRYDRDGYVIETSEPNDLFILKSPYFTRCQFCSPCAPGAGYITNTVDDGPRAYCLGHDWFEDNKAPYPVYSVETGELIQPG